MPSVKAFALKVAERLQANAIREGAKEYADVLAEIQAEDVITLIKAKKPLNEILPRRIVTHPTTLKIVDSNPDMLLEILEKYNPKLAMVLRTPEGRAWWSLNGGQDS